MIIKMKGKIMIKKTVLDFTDIDSLEMICHHYKLDATFKEKDALKGKMEKANLLVLDKKTGYGY